jgi:hypothetical protein
MWEQTNGTNLCVVNRKIVATLTLGLQLSVKCKGP